MENGFCRKCSRQFRVETKKKGLEVITFGVKKSCMNEKKEVKKGFALCFMAPFYHNKNIVPGIAFTAIVKTSTKTKEQGK